MSNARRTTNVPIHLDLRRCNFRLLSNYLGRKSLVLLVNSPPILGQSLNLSGIPFPFSLGGFELPRKPLNLGTDALDFLVVPRSHDVIFHHYNIFIKSFHHLKRNRNRGISTLNQFFKGKKVRNEP